MRYGRKQRPSTQVSGWLQSSSELPLALGAVMWYDASDLSTITATSGEVSEWRDKSGFGRHLYTTNPAKFQTGLNTINGLNTLYNDGSDVYSGQENSTRFIAYATFFVVMRHISQSGIVFASRGSGNFWGVYDAGSGSGGSSFFGTVTQKVNGVSVANTRSALWTALNGKTVLVQANCSNPNQAPNHEYYPFSYGAGANFIGEVDAGEVIAFNKQLTAGEEGLVESYLKAKWGLTY